MSDLVKRLCSNRWDQLGANEDCREAADRIEALEDKNARLLKVQDELADFIEGQAEEISRLREALDIAANRLDRCAGIIAIDRARDQAFEWADETRAALKGDT